MAKRGLYESLAGLTMNQMTHQQKNQYYGLVVVIKKAPKGLWSTVKRLDTVEDAYEFIKFKDGLIVVPSFVYPNEEDKDEIAMFRPLAKLTSYRSAISIEPVGMSIKRAMKRIQMYTSDMGRIHRHRGAYIEFHGEKFENGKDNFSMASGYLLKSCESLIDFGEYADKFLEEVGGNV